MRLHIERNPYKRPGFRLLFQPFRRGCGYRAYDFPWHSQNVASPRWRTRAWLSYIPGFTLIVGTHQREIRSRKQRRLYVSWTSNGNTRCQCVPQWW